MNVSSAPTTGVEIWRAPERLHAGNVKRELAAVQARPGTIVGVDLGATLAIDSTALGELVRIHRGLLASGGRLVLIAPGSAVRRVLKITRLDTLFAIHGDTSEVGSRGASS